MPTTIKLKNSVTTTSVPSSLVQGEVAINITDKKVWVGNAATTPIQIAGAGTTGNAAGSNTQVQYNSSGSFAGDADFTFNGTTVTMANDASISGLTVGKGAGAISTNTVLGASALAANTTGASNTAMGESALAANTTASNNTAVGYQAGVANTTGRITAVGHRVLYGNTTGTGNTGVGGNDGSVGSALLSNTTGGNNTAVGIGALLSNVTASDSTAVGYTAGYNNTTGLNTFIGRNAGFANTTGKVTAVGAYALNSNTTGAGNVGLGGNDGTIQAALQATTTGSYNTAVGTGSLASNTTASNNTAVGYQSLYTNSTGAENTAVGYFALKTSTTGSQTAVGSYAMQKSTTGISNTAVGHVTLFENTTGSYNTALGQEALRNNTTASNNTAVGYQAGYAVTTGAENTAVGRTALQNATTGSGNTVIGEGSGNAITTGGKNTIVGRYSGNAGGLDIRTANNWIVLSDGDGNARLYWDGTNSRWRAPSGQFQIQYAYDTTSGSAANVIVGSDGAMFRSTSALKYKTDVRDLENIDINKFRPVRYKSKSKIDDPTKDHIGIIADEVDAAGIKELVTYGIDGEVEGFQYERLTVVLLKAVQELTAEVTSLKAQLNK
jgi:hypothetical protein